MLLWKFIGAPAIEVAKIAIYLKRVGVGRLNVASVPE
jgi:hypothetical protein